MAGHSKWKQIKHKKGIKDQKRGQLFSKLSRLITLAVIEGGGLSDPSTNVRLRLVIEKAKGANMPKENIQRAIERASGRDRELIKEVVYEGFGPSGVNLMILATTDNPNRTLSEIRSVLDKNGGKLGVQGSVSYLFTKCGSAIFEKENNKEESVLKFAENIQAFDMEDDQTSVIVYFPFENLGKVQEYKTEVDPDLIGVDFKPQNIVKIDKREDAKKILNLVELLESLDDVQRVYSNFDIPEEFIDL